MSSSIINQKPTEANQFKPMTEAGVFGQKISIEQTGNTYQKYKKKRNKHQHNTDDGGQAMGEEMWHVQMSR